jgi:hypothetical protein
MYLCVRDNESFLCVYGFSIRILNCSEIAVLLFFDFIVQNSFIIELKMLHFNANVKLGIYGYC